MTDELTREDCSFILTSLDFTRMKFESYDGYPSEEFRRIRLADVAAVAAKIQQIRKAMAPRPERGPKRHRSEGA